MLLSLLLYLARTSQPAVRAIIPGAGGEERKFRILAAGEVECPQLKIVRIEGSIYFGAVNHVAERMQGIAEKHAQQRHLLLMAKSINFVDVAGAELLAEEARRRRRQGGRLWFYGIRPSAEELLHKPEFLPAFGEGAFFTSKRRAIGHIVAELDASVCSRCRARIFEECRGRPGAVV
jgi:sulfate permease, SulP family